MNEDGKLKESIDKMQKMQDVMNLEQKAIQANIVYMEARFEIDGSDEVKAKIDRFYKMLESNQEKIDMVEMLSGIGTDFINLKDE